MNLYEIDKTISHLLDQVDENGEITMEAYEAFNNLQMNIELKLESLAKKIKNKKLNIQIIDEEMERLKKKKDSIGKNIEGMEQYVIDYLVNNGISKAEYGLFSLGVRKSEAVIINEGVNLPEEYTTKVETIKVDKKKLKDDLKNGVIIEGAYIENRNNLQIK